MRSPRALRNRALEIDGIGTLATWGKFGAIIGARLLRLRIHDVTALQQMMVSLVLQVVTEVAGRFSFHSSSVKDTAKVYVDGLLWNRKTGRQEERFSRRSRTGVGTATLFIRDSVVVLLVEWLSADASRERSSMGRCLTLRAWRFD